jgi:CheY-like chemotaxis protein
MSAVLGILHLLHNTSLSEEQSSYVSTVETSAKHLLQIINDVLDFSSLESGKVFMMSESFNLREVFTNVRSLLHGAAQAKGLAFSSSVDADVPNVLIGDPMRLQQVLISLADNAIKFTTQGSVQLRVQRESSDGETIILRFSVQDTGIGLNMDDPERLFRAFIQGDTSETRQYGGIGLGLTVARSLVEMMEGRIWYESNMQKGSTFFFTATLKLPKEEVKTIHFPASLLGQPILLVEDNTVNQIVATKMLEEKGFVVDAAPNGLRAVEMVQQKDYALVLMDIQMPEMNGYQATQAIRQMPEFSSLPIVALTANAMEDDRRRCLETGMNDHVAKPINPMVLYQAILQWAKPVSEAEP